MDGSEANSKVEGVVGVKRLEAGLTRLRDDGVRGNANEFLPPTVVFEGDVTGKGMANSRSAALRFTGDFVGDRESDGGGASANEEIPFGDANTSSRTGAGTFDVNADAKSGGKSALGMLGIGIESP